MCYISEYPCQPKHPRFLVKNSSEFEALQQASEPSTPKASPHQKRGSGSKYEHMFMFLVDRYDARLSFDTMIVAIHG